MVRTARNDMREKYPRAYRFFEILPGLVSWSLILFPVWGSFVFPMAVAYFILFFDVFWVYKSVTLAGSATVAHWKINAASKLNWLKELEGFGADAKRVKHLIIIPTFGEPLHTLRATLIALVNQDYPLDKLAVVLATEERENQAIVKAEKIKREFGNKFGVFMVTRHPDIEGEVKGKSSNAAWAAKKAKQELLVNQKWELDYMTISSCDADARFHPKYFSYLTFKFLDDPHRYSRFWQPAVMFYNNIWRVPAPIRVVNTFATVWQTALLVRTDRLINYSTYSTSMKLMDEVGYWDTDVIPEDWRMFFKAFYAKQGKVEVSPIFLPVHADAAESTGYIRSMINQYEQIKRWAWGASDDAYIMLKFLTVPKVSFWDKIIRLARVVEDHFLWPVYWFIITLGVNIPLWVNPNFNRTIVGYTLPRLSSAILTVSILFLLVVLVVDARQRPKRPKQVFWLKPLLMPLEFILMPITGLFFNALPGLDAHTRLMLGKYMEYRVTEKV